MQKSFILYIWQGPCAYQGVRNVSFSKTFTYVLNGWSQRSQERPWNNVNVLYFSVRISDFQEEKYGETHQSKLWRSTNGVWSNISWVMRIFQTGLYSFMFLLKIYIFCVEANLFGYICSYHQLMELFSSLYSNKQT